MRWFWNWYGGMGKLDDQSVDRLISVHISHSLKQLTFNKLQQKPQVFPNNDIKTHFFNRSNLRVNIKAAASGQHIQG